MFDIPWESHPLSTEARPRGCLSHRPERWRAAGQLSGGQQLREWRKHQHKGHQHYRPGSSSLPTTINEGGAMELSVSCLWHWTISLFFWQERVKSHSSLLTVYRQRDVTPRRVTRPSCFFPAYNYYTWLSALTFFTQSLLKCLLNNFLPPKLKQKPSVLRTTEAHDHSQTQHQDATIVEAIWGTT